MRRTAASPPRAPGRSTAGASHDLESFVREDLEKLGRERTLDEQRALIEAVLKADQGDVRDIGDPPIDLEANLYPSERDAFPDMLERLRGRRPLTDKQLGWVMVAAERLGVAAPSNEPVPRGREVEPAPVLRELPKVPPGRKPPPEPAPALARPVETKAERGVPCACGGKGLGVNGFHYPGAPGCLRTPETVPGRAALLLALEEPPPVPSWLWAFARLLDLPRGSVERTYVAARRLDRRCTRTPEGDIDNCSLVNGEAEQECQICQGTCPDRDLIGSMRRAFVRKTLDELGSKAKPANVPPPDSSWEDDIPF